MSARSQPEIDALIQEALELHAERDRIDARLLAISEAVTSSARWVGGHDGRWVAATERAEMP